MCEYGVGTQGIDSLITYDGASLSFNTLSHYATQIPEASCAEEAKWNVAFWLQDPLTRIPRFIDMGSGAGWADPEDVDLMGDYAAALGHPPYCPMKRFPSSDPEAHYYVRDLPWLLGRVAKRFHAEGLLEATLGRTVPIIIHDLEYGNDGAEATRANPSALVEAFFRDFLGP